MAIKHPAGMSQIFGNAFSGRGSVSGVRIGALPGQKSGSGGADLSDASTETLRKMAAGLGASNAGTASRETLLDSITRNLKG